MPGKMHVTWLYTHHPVMLLLSRQKLMYEYLGTSRGVCQSNDDGMRHVSKSQMVEASRVWTRFSILLWWLQQSTTSAVFSLLFLTSRLTEFLDALLQLLRLPNVFTNGEVRTYLIYIWDCCHWKAAFRVYIPTPRSCAYSTMLDRGSWGLGHGGLCLCRCW